MESEEKVIGILGLIALRKSELCQKVLNEIAKQKDISEHEVNRITTKISQMPNDDFISSKEKELHKINQETKLDDLDIDIQGVIQKMGYSGD